MQGNGLSSWRVYRDLQNFLVGKQCKPTYRSNYTSVSILLHSKCWINHYIIEVFHCLWKPPCLVWCEVTSWPGPTFVASVIADRNLINNWLIQAASTKSLRRMRRCWQVYAHYWPLVSERRWLTGEPLRNEWARHLIVKFCWSTGDDLLVIDNCLRGTPAAWMLMHRFAYVASSNHRRIWSFCMRFARSERKNIPPRRDADVMELKQWKTP